MNFEWKIEIKNRITQFLTDIWIYRQGMNDKIIILSYSGQIAEEKEYDMEGKELLPSITLPTELLPLLLQQLLGNGVKSPAKDFVEGKLQAVEYHLEDMRKLLKLNIK